MHSAAAVIIIAYALRLPPGGQTRPGIENQSGGDLVRRNSGETPALPGTN